MKNFYDKRNHWDEDKHKQVLEEKRMKKWRRELEEQKKQRMDELFDDPLGFLPDASVLNQHRPYRILNQVCKEIWGGRFGVEFPGGTRLKIDGDGIDLPIMDEGGNVVGETSSIWFNGKNIVFNGWSDKEFNRYDAESSTFDIQSGVLSLNIIAIVGRNT